MPSEAPQKNVTTMRWFTLGILYFTVAALSAGPVCAAPAATGAVADLTIHIENMSPDGGVLRLGVYDEAHYPDNNSTPVASADVVAVAGETTVTLRGLSPGIYAIETFQDINSNGIMDMSWLGLPLEPFGFSQDASPFLSKPSFSEVKFTLMAGENIQIIHLQNSVTGSPAAKARDAIRARQLP
jgi:uncharacterized protein (DUF2141 family)